MIKGVIFDLDGTVYWGKKEVPGAGSFVRELKQQGIKYVFVTNRANRPPDVVSAHLREYGIECDDEHVVTTAYATAEYMGGGSAWYIGEEGLKQELDRKGITITDQSPDYVVVSFDRYLTYDKIKTACKLIHGGAKFIATNPDKALKMSDGIVPGTGAIVAAIEAGCGVKPLVIGKPEKYVMEIGLQRMGLGRDDVIAIGDNVNTDIPAGINAGIRTAFILTGVSTLEDLHATPWKPTWIVDNYDELSEILRVENG